MFLALEIHMYGVMIAVGILLCFCLLWLFEKLHKIDHKFMDFINTNSIVAIIVGFGSAALFQSIYNYIENPEAGFRLTGSITFMGGLIGGAISFIGIYLIFRKRHNTKLIEIIYFIPAAIVVAHAFGRVGCYFGECCYGVETTSWIGVVLSNGRKVLPTHLMEACFLFILFGVLFYLAYKKKFLYTMPLYMVAYGIWRFVIEFFRGDHRGDFVGNISPSQFWSILMVIGAIPVFFLLRYLFKKRQIELEEISKQMELDKEKSLQEQISLATDEK